MEYRTLPRTGEKISVIGMGTAYIGEQNIDDIVSVTEKALDYGINYFDLAAGHRPAIEGIGISVMKPFCGGQLLDKEKSPFGEALAINQCIQYALDKPGVLTVLPGFATEEDLDVTMKYFEATEEEKDYSILGKLTPLRGQDSCVYCRHCHPCPAGLDIALINKYYDLACLGDVMAEEHYRTLEKTASDCISCGHCNFRCPFGVNQNERMISIKNYFGI